jgi:hypothetical protein
VQSDPAAQPAPSNTNGSQAPGSGPLLQGLLAQLQGNGTSSLPLLAHDMHAPLVLNADATAARDGVDDVDLFAVLFDQVADVDVPVQARVRVVLLFGGWVRWVRGRLLLVHSEPPSSVGRSPGARERSPGSMVSC